MSDAVEHVADRSTDEVHALQAHMWTRYAYKDVEVQLIQKWADPFGKRMVRIADVLDPGRAMGLGEEEFMAEATLSATQDEIGCE